MEEMHPPVLVGLIGEGIQASRSPLLHEAEARAAGLRYFYHLIDLQKLDIASDALPLLLDAAQLLGFAGVNVTHPCKQSVIPFLDELSEAAQAIGAVNTVVFSEGRRIGHNTDWWGFAESFKRGLADASLNKVVLLGAGGAGAAVAHAALTLGAQQIAIHDPDKDKAKTLAERLCRNFGQQRAVPANNLVNELAEADGLIHASPVGMLGHPGLPLNARLLRPELWVAEIVYFPLETELLKQARMIGCRTLDGGGMAVFQAVEALRLFTGIKPDHERMLRHFSQMKN